MSTPILSSTFPSTKISSSSSTSPSISIPSSPQAASEKLANTVNTFFQLLKPFYIKHLIGPLDAPTAEQSFQLLKDTSSSELLSNIIHIIIDHFETSKQLINIELETARTSMSHLISEEKEEKEESSKISPFVQDKLSEHLNNIFQTMEPIYIKVLTEQLIEKEIAQKNFENLKSTFISFINDIPLILVDIVKTRAKIVINQIKKEEERIKYARIQLEKEREKLEEEEKECRSKKEITPSKHSGLFSTCPIL